MNLPEGQEIYRIQSEQQMISVAQENDLRLLRVDPHTVQSAMSLNAPHKLILPNMELMMLFLLFQQRPDKILMLGLGGGDMLRYLHHVLPEAALQVAESDAAMVRISREYFFLPEAPNVEIIHSPGEEFMQQTRHHYDTLLIDINSHGSALPDLLLDTRFYALCHARLSSNGIMVLNLITEDADLFRNILWDIRQTFARHTLCLSVPDHNNVIIAAFKQKPALRTQAELLAQAQAISPSYDLNFSAIVDNLFATNPLEDNQLILG